METEKEIRYMWNELPKDPMILLSVVNTKLRNHYDSLDAFCQDMGIEKQELTDRLGQIDYEYMEERNQFV